MNYVTVRRKKPRVDLLPQVKRKCAKQNLMNVALTYTLLRGLWARLLGLVVQGSGSRILRFGVALALGSVTVLAVLRGRSQCDALHRSAYFFGISGYFAPGPPL